MDGPGDDLAQYEVQQTPDDLSAFEVKSPQPTASVSAQPEPQGISGHIAQWAENVSSDIKYGTDKTGVGTVLKKLGAHGVYAGEPQAVGDFMASLPLGLLRATKGEAESEGATSTKAAQRGASDIVGGLGQAATMPGAFVAPEAAEGAASAAGKILPNAQRAGGALQEVKNVAGEIPVNMETAEKTIAEIIKQEDRGGDAVPAVKKLAARLESGEPLKYEEIKDFQGNISALSASEKIGYKPNTFRLLGQLNGELKEALTDAADVEGKGQKFVQAMKEYHNAMRLKEFTDEAKATALRWGLKAAGVYGLAKLFKFEARD